MEAREALAAAALDMANVTAEKRSLLQQWQAALLAVRQRDSALQVCVCVCASSRLCELVDAAAMIFFPTLGSSGLQPPFPGP